MHRLNIAGKPTGVVEGANLLHIHRLPCNYSVSNDITKQADMPCQIHKKQPNRSVHLIFWLHFASLGFVTTFQITFLLTSHWKGRDFKPWIRLKRTEWSSWWQSLKRSVVITGMDAEISIQDPKRSILKQIKASLPKADYFFLFF